MNWIFKQKRSENIRAICSNCGYKYPCSYFDVETHSFVVDTVYNYCPNCGEKDENIYDDYVEVEMVKDKEENRAAD